MEEDQKRELRIYCCTRTKSNQVVLKASTRNLVAEHCGATNEFEALAFIQKDVAVLKHVTLVLVGREVHFVNFSRVNPIFQHIGHPQVRSQMLASMMLGRTLPP